MQIRFLLGPAGSGKTFRCLAEIREELLKSPEGPPLLLLAPKQATFQLERQLLDFPRWVEPEASAANGSPGVSPHPPTLYGYTRLQILSFDRLADFILGEFAGAPRDRLDEEGRVMVLRALLGRNLSKLKIFHATARLPGFAQQLNLLLREFQRQQLSPQRLAGVADQLQARPALAAKLHDAALMLDAYLDWLRTHGLQDANGLPDLAAGVLRRTIASGGAALRVGGLWLDGFAEMTPQSLAMRVKSALVGEVFGVSFWVNLGRVRHASTDETFSEIPPGVCRQ